MRSGINFSLTSLLTIAAAIGLTGCGPGHSLDDHSNLNSPVAFITELLAQLGVPTSPYGAIFLLTGDESPLQRERREREQMRESWRNPDNAGADIPAEMRRNSSGTALTASARQRHFFKIGTDKKLWHLYTNPTGEWQTWEDLGGQLASNPVSVQTATGEIHVFARGTDNALHHRWYSGSWSHWENLGGSFVGTPSVAVTQGGKFLVVVRNANNDIWKQTYFRGWSGWTQLIGQTTDDLAVVNSGLDQVQVFARGTNARLYSWSYRFSNNSWSGASDHGGSMFGRPSVAVQWDNYSLDSAHRIFVAVRGGTNSAIYTLTWGKDSGWGGWNSIGGTIVGTPSISVTDAQIDIVGMTPERSTLHLFSRDGGRFFQSENLGGFLGSIPGATWYDDGKKFEVLSLGGDSKTLWHRSYSDGWSGWRTLGSR